MAWSNEPKVFCDLKIGDVFRGGKEFRFYKKISKGSAVDIFTNEKRSFKKYQYVDWAKHWYD